MAFCRSPQPPQPWRRCLGHRQPGGSSHPRPPQPQVPSKSSSLLSIDSHPDTVNTQRVCLLLSHYFLSCRPAKCGLAKQFRMGCMVMRRSSILPSAFTQPIVIREDTEYLSFGDGCGGGVPANAGRSGSMGGGSSSGLGGSCAALNPTSAPADETGPLPMYEDTQFLTGSLQGGFGGGEGQQQSAGGVVASSGLGGSGSFGSGGFGSGGFGGDDTGLLVREDTCFLPDAPVAGDSLPGLVIYSKDCLSVRPGTSTNSRQL